MSVTLHGEDEPWSCCPASCWWRRREREGFAVAQEGGLVVALDTELDDELLQEGLARDLVRLINDMRKAAGFDISDRIVTYYRVGRDGANASAVRGALSTFNDYIPHGNAL